MTKTPKIADPIVNYQTDADIEDLTKLLAITQRDLHTKSLTYGQLVKTGEKLERMAAKWRDLARDAEIIEHDVAA